MNQPSSIEPLNRFILLLVLLFSFNAQSDAWRVLQISDSVGIYSSQADGFTSRIDKNLRSNSRVVDVRSYAVCAWSMLRWMESGGSTTCGYESHVSNGGKLKINSRYVKTHRVPSLGNLLSTYKPNALLIQTGSNLYDWGHGSRPTNFNSGKGAVVKGQIHAVVEKFADYIVDHSQDLKLCVVVTPPPGQKKVPLAYYAMIQESLKTKLSSVCGVVVSSDLDLELNFSSRDGYHLAKGRDHQSWTDQVWKYAKDYFALKPSEHVTLKEKSSESLSQIEHMSELEREVGKNEIQDPGLMWKEAQKPFRARLRLEKTVVVEGKDTIATVRGYGQSVSRAKWKVLEVLEGEILAPGKDHILLLHPFIRHKKPLPALSRKVGTEVTSWVVPVPLGWYSIEDVSSVVGRDYTDDVEEYFNDEDTLYQGALLEESRLRFTSTD